MKCVLKFKRRNSSKKVLMMKKRIVRFMKNKKRQPSLHSASKNERLLAMKMRNYINPATYSFDKEFTKYVKSFDYYTKAKTERTVQYNLMRIEKFLNKPTRGEQITAAAIHLLKNKDYLTKDQLRMVKQFYKKPTPKLMERKENTVKLLNFVSKYGRIPRSSSGLLSEKKLGMKWAWILASNNPIKKEVHKRLVNYHRRFIK